jgi:hypothetical protein
MRYNLTVVIYKDKQNVHILMNIQRPPTEGNFYDKQGKAQTPLTVTDYT